MEEEREGRAMGEHSAPTDSAHKDAQDPSVVPRAVVQPNNIDSSPSDPPSSATPPSSPEHSAAIIRRPVDEEESTALLEGSEEGMSDGAHSKGHGHSHGASNKHRNTLPCVVMITLTFCFFLVELIFGFVNRSIALLADSYHMLSDVFALTVALVCLWIANRPSKYSTFGWVRSEVFGALINGVWLVTMCYTIALESFGRIVHPRAVAHPGQILIVGTIGLIVNCIGIYVFHSAGVGHGHSHGGDGGGHGHSHGGGHGHSHSGHGHSHGGHGHSHDSSDDEEACVEEARTSRAHSHGNNDNCHQHLAMRLVNLDNVESVGDLPETTDGEEDCKEVVVHDKHNLNMQGAFLHIITDAVGSIIVILSAALALFFPDLLGGFQIYLDPALSLVLVAIITFSALGLVRQTSEIVLRLCPSFVDYDALKKQIVKIRGVTAVTDINVWTLVANRHLATADIEFHSAQEYDGAVLRIRKLFHRHGVHSLTIQPIFTSPGAPAIREESITPDSDSNGPVILETTA